MCPKLKPIKEQLACLQLHSSTAQIINKAHCIARHEVNGFKKRPANIFSPYAHTPLQGLCPYVQADSMRAHAVK